MNITVSEGLRFENVFFESKIKDKIMDIVIKGLGILFCIMGIVYLLTIVQLEVQVGQFLLEWTTLREGM